MRYLKFMEDRGQISGAGLSTATLILMLTIVNISSLNAQRHMTLGALQNVPQQSLINPAITPNSTWHVGIPLASGISPTYNSSSLTPAHFGFGSAKSPDFFRAMEYADTLNKVNGEFYLEALSVGVNVGQHYFSLSLAERAIASVEYSDQLVQWLGYEQEGEDIALGQVFNLKDWNFAAAHYRELSLGIARKLLDEKFTIAARAKVLFGQAAVQSDNRNLRLWHRPEEDYNYEITGRMDVLASGFDRFGEGQSFIQPFGSSNVGFALDMGAQLKLGNATFFASITDLGTLNWKKNNSFTSITDIAVDADEILQTAKDNLANDRERGATNFNTELVTKAYAGAQFNIGDRHAVSLLVNPRYYDGKSEMNASLAFRVHTSKFLDLVASYNVIAEEYNNIGFGATVNLKPVQLYFATDRASSVFDRNSKKDFQFIAGVNLLFGQPKDELAIARNKKKGTEEEDPFGASPLPLNGNSEFAPNGTDELVAKGGQKDKYITFYGTVFDDETDEPLEAIYVDVYVIGPDDQRELLHTSRYPGHTFNVPLFQSDLKHEISVGGYGYARQTLSFTADVDRLEHSFRMSDGYWSNEEPEVVVDAGRATLVHTPADTLVQEEIAEKGPIEEDIVEVEPEEIVASTETGSFEITLRTSLRSEPDPQARVMKRLAIGTQLILLEKTNRDWWKMQLGDQIGYVKQRLLERVFFLDTESFK